MPSSRALILNVDDNAAKRYVKTRVLTEAGYDVIGADCGAEAQAAVLQHKPDLVLLDVKLPDMNGREVCAWIRARPDVAQTVVLQTSAYIDRRIPDLAQWSRIQYRHRGSIRYRLHDERQHGYGDLQPHSRRQRPGRELAMERDLHVHAIALKGSYR